MNRRDPSSLEAGVGKFIQRLQQSRLLKDDMVETLSLSTGESADARAVAEQLVGAAQITRWQAEQLIRGCQSFDVGNYRLMAPIGAGGMGIVYRAVHRRLHREVAFKVLRPELLSGPKPRLRFENEIQTLAALHHPGIVKIFDADVVGKFNYLVMELLDGMTLESCIGSMGKLPSAIACECICQAGYALQYAHRHGLVHRDVKPANLFLHRVPGTEQRVIKVLDLGLVLRTTRGESGDLTQTGDLLGTADYIAPEQLQDARRADPRSDVFGLGCSLFRLVTGHFPYGGETSMQRMVARLIDRPQSPRSYVPEIPVDLERIILRCLARDVQDRFQSTAELSQSLRAYSSDEFQELFDGLHGSAAPPCFADQDDPLAEWLDQLASATEVDSRAVAATQHQSNERRPSRWIAIAAATICVVVLGIYGWAYLSDRDSLSSYELPGGCWALQSDPRETNVNVIEQLGHGELTHWDIVSCVRFSPDGQLICSSDLAGSIRIWDVASGELRRSIFAETAVHSVAFHPRIPLLAFATADGSLSWIDLVTGDRKSLSSHGPEVDLEAHVIAFNSSGSRLADGQPDGSISIWDIATQSEVAHLKGHAGIVNGLSFVPGSDHLVSAATDGSVRIWDAVTGRQVETLVSSSTEVLVQALATSPNGDHLITGDSEGRVQVWNLQDRSERPFFIQGQHDVNAVLFGSNGRCAIGDSSGRVVIYDADWHEQLAIQASSQAIASLAIAPKSDLLATGCHANAVGVFRFSSGQRVIRRDQRTTSVTGLAYHPSGELLATASTGGESILWSGAPPYDILKRSQLGGPAHDVTFSGDGQFLSIAYDDASLSLWRRSPDFTEELIVDSVPRDIVAVAFDRNAQSLFLCTRLGQLTAFDIRNTASRQTDVSVASGKVKSIDVSADSRWLVVGYVDNNRFNGIGKLSVVDLADPDHGRLPLGVDPSGSIWCLDCHPTKNWAASGSYGGSVRIWDLDARSQLYELPMDSGNVYCLAFSPDGRALATVTYDGLLRIWEVGSTTPPAGPSGSARLVQSGAVINEIEFHPDGRTLVTANGNGTVFVVRRP